MPVVWWKKRNTKGRLAAWNHFWRLLHRFIQVVSFLFFSQVLTKTAILAQRKVAEDGLVVKLLDEGLRVSFMVSLVGTGRLLWLILFDQFLFGSQKMSLVSILTGVAMVKFLKEGPCHTMIGGE